MDKTTETTTKDKTMSDYIIPLIAGISGACFTIAIVIAAILLERSSKCIHCGTTFRASKPARLTFALTGEVTEPRCPACERAWEIFALNRDWPECERESVTTHNTGHNRLLPRN